MTDDVVKKENFIKIGAKQWFDKSKGKLLASYQAGGKKNETNELYQMPSGIFIAQLWRYSEGSAYSDCGSYHSEWKILTVENLEFQMFLDHMDPIPAKWVTHRTEIK